MTRSVAVAVDGGPLHATLWGEGPRVVLGIHGVTASSMSLVAVARHLGTQYTLVAPDLRGRGRSNHLPGPYGMRRHAQDCAAVVRAVTDGPLVVVGQSMGAYVAVVLAASYPELVERLVLADGGLPMALPEGLDPEVVIDAALGPALSRLQTVFPSRAAYRDFWRAHPAVSEEWNDDVEAYLDYDLEAVDGGFRSRVCEEAARFDAVEPLAHPGLVEESFSALRCRVDLLRAPRNLMNQPLPLFPDRVVAEWCTRMPVLHDEVVADTNHYTLMLGRRGSEAMAAKIQDPSARAPA